MKTIPLITRLKRSSPARIVALVLGLAMALVAGGCVSISEGLAEAPYEKAMKQGRMLPSEFRKEQENIQRAAEPVS
jgi:hypothetical protein